MKNHSFSVFLKIIFLFFLFTNLHSQSFPGYREFKEGQEAIQWWSRLYENLILTQEEKNIIYDYTYGHFGVINEILRSGTPLSSLKDSQKDMVSRLDKALSKTILFENIITYRYERIGFISRLIRPDFFFDVVYKNGRFLEGAAERYLATLVGKHYKDYGFMSTTLIRNSVFQSRPIELIIKVPRLADAMFVSVPELAASPEQYELLFPRNRVLEFESFSISQDRRKITFIMKMSAPCRIDETCIEPIIDNLRQPDRPEESHKAEESMQQKEESQEKI